MKGSGIPKRNGRNMLNHDDRYIAFRNAFKSETGRKLHCFLVIGVDEAGEIYYGGDYGTSKCYQKALLEKCQYFQRQLKKQIAKGVI